MDAWNADVNILHRNKPFFTILDSRYYGVKNVEAGDEAVEHPTITVTEYEGDKVQAKIVPPLHRSRTDSIISYSNPGNNPAKYWEILWLSSGLAEAVGSTFYITKEGNIDLSVVLKVSIDPHDDPLN